MKKTTEKTSDAGPAVTEDTVQEADAAVAAEIARLNAENAELRDALRLGSARETVTAGLAAAGARSPVLLFDRVSGDLQFADDGAVQNATAIVARLKAEFPEQFGRPLAASVDAAAGQIASAPLSKAALARMTPKEIAALNWDDVRSVLAEK